MTWTDGIIFLILTCATAIGVSHGLMRSLARPLTFLFSSLLGYAIFYLSRNLASGLAVMILGPLLIPWVIKILFTDPVPSDQPPLSMLSRFGGAAVNLAWSGTVIGLILTAISIIPLKHLGMEMTRMDISSSHSYRLLQSFISSKKTAPAPLLETVPSAAQLPTCPDESCAAKQAALTRLANNENVQSLMEDDRIKKIMEDPELRDAIEKKDYSRIMKSSLVTEIAQDPQLLAKILKIFPTVQAEMKQFPDEE